jgi:putative ABC transport system permease protein
VFKNYVKVAMRYLLAHKGYSLINIFGLAVGITCCILMMLFVRSEFSYDRFHSKSDRLYRVWQHEKYQGEDFINVVTPLPMAGAIQHSYPEVEATCRVYNFKPAVKIDQTSFTQSVCMVDSTFFKMFDFDLLQADKLNAFPNSNTVIVTNTIAKKYFGESTAFGKKIELQFGDDKVPFIVGGIINNPPESSSIRFEMLIPYSNAKYIFRPGLFNSWFNVFNETYLLLRKNASAALLEKKFPAMMKQQLGQDYKEGGFVLHLQPITNIHLNNALPAGNQPISNPKYSYIVVTIAMLVLLVACINFITLSIGRSTARALEVGVRKALGAERKQLVAQFWGEALLVTLIAVVLGLALSSSLLKPFNALVQKELSLDFDPTFLAFCILMIGIIGLIAGIYPAIILSRFNPVQVLKGKLNMRSNTSWLRRSLIVGQFVASIAMIISTIVIQKQIHFLKNKDLGYNKEQLVIVSTNKGRKDGIPLAQLYKNEISKLPEVADAGISIFSLAENVWAGLGFTDDARVYRSFQYNAVDADFMRVMKFTMANGRSFQPSNMADESNAAIVNEAFIKYFKITDPIGKKLPGKFDQQIIGVVKDFNYQSLHNEVAPLLLTMKADSVLRRTENIDITYPPQPRITVRLKGGTLAENINHLKTAWKKVAPAQEFEYKFLDDTLAAQYAQETRTSDIVQLASAISIIIACMGLFGLATLAVVRRTREIGIRKVLGASAGNIVTMISKEFVIVVIVASVIAFPLAWWFLSDWLKDFAYRVNVSWWIYMVGGMMAMLIALLTVSVQAIRAAMANPVKSLRTE